MQSANVILNKRVPNYPADITTFDAESGSADLYSTGTFPIGISEQWTIAYWVRPTILSQGAGNNVVRLDSSGADNRVSINLFNMDSNIYVYDKDGANAQHSRVEDLPTFGGAQNWKFWVVSYDYNSGTVLMPIYYQGAILPTSVQSGPGDPWVDVISTGNPQQDTVDREIGLCCRAGGFDNWNGLMYDVGIWDSILTAAEITALYNSANADEVDYRVALGDYTSTANLRCYYRFDDTGNRGKNDGLVGSAGDCDGESGTTYVTNDYPGYGA